MYQGEPLSSIPPMSDDVRALMAPSSLTMSVLIGSAIPGTVNENPG
jgi:hypothetical protein